MKIFLSWSGERSKKIAEYLNTWIPCVIQAAEPWFSSTDIDRGSNWFQEINNSLADVKIGIICLTQENKRNPWILFEAGCLAKGLNSQHVCTLLVDAQPQDIENPLAQFNHTLPQRNNMYELMKTINKQISQPLRDNVLEQTFEKYWPDSEEKFRSIITSTDTQESYKRTTEDILTEILNTVRLLDKRFTLKEEYDNILLSLNNPSSQDEFDFDNFMKEYIPVFNRKTANEFKLNIKKDLKNNMK